MALSRFEQADESPGFLLWQLTNLWQQDIRRALAPLGITHVQFVLLASIAWQEQTEPGSLISQALLARHAHTDVMMTSQVVRALEEKGLLARAMHPTDTRARVISLTADGREIAQQAMKVVEAADARFFQAAGEDAATLLAVMRRLIAGHHTLQSE